MRSRSSKATRLRFHGSLGISFLLEEGRELAGVRTPWQELPLDICETIREFMRRGVVIRTVNNGDQGRHAARRS
jgi:hypothetical protein